MIGKLIGTAIRVVTLPLDAANAGMDLLTGGDGSKKSRAELQSPLTILEEIRDRTAEAAEDIDEK